jgi:Undecaprenyl-phosphate glucose phosphotransferase
MRHDAKTIKSVTSANVAVPSLQDIWAKRRETLQQSLPTVRFFAPSVTAGLIRMAECVLIALTGFIALARYPGIEGLEPLLPYMIMIAAISIGVPILMQSAGAYSLQALLNPFRHLPRVFGTWALTFCIAAVVLFAFKSGAVVSRAWFVTWAASGLMLYIAGRFAIAAVLRHFNQNGAFNRRAILVGGGANAENVISTLQNSHDTGVSIVGIFDDRYDDRSPDDAQGIKKLGTLNDLIDFVRSTRVDTLILTLPVTAEERLMSILRQLWILPVDIRLSAHGQKLRYRPRAYSYIGNLALLDLFDRPLGDWGPILKSIEDKVIAAIALLLLSPVFAAVALAVKLDSKGPVLFRQKRYGFNNELIGVYKFRSMYADKTDADARKLVTKGDPRVTRVGRFIRRTSLDELPQLFNVLKGELSLVGPRPHATQALAAGNLYEAVVDGYFARHKVKPGMTGWAQVNGWRGETDTAEKIERRVEHDLYYIENWSLTFDLYILARTPLALLKPESAY